MFDFFDGVAIEIAATIKDYGECKKELDEPIVWDLVHQEHGEDENGCGAEDGDDEFFDGISSNKNESLDVYDLMSFLNEYYLVYPDQLPKKELF